MHVCLMYPDLKHLFTTIYVKMNYTIYIILYKRNRLSSPSTLGATTTPSNSAFFSTGL